MHKLLQALALQIGSEVSYTELSGLIGIDKNTVEKYVQLLEQSFVLLDFLLMEEINAGRYQNYAKYFFGIQVFVILLYKILIPLSLRNDAGRLFEN